MKNEDWLFLSSLVSFAIYMFGYARGIASVNVEKKKNVTTIRDNNTVIILDGSIFHGDVGTIVSSYTTDDLEKFYLINPDGWTLKTLLLKENQIKRLYENEN